MSCVIVLHASGPVRQTGPDTLNLKEEIAAIALCYTRGGGGVGGLSPWRSEVRD